MDYDPLIVRETGFVRLVRAMGLLRVEEPAPATPGSDFAEGSPTHAQYDQRRAMSALAASPYYAACVLAKAGDLAGLPIVVARRVEKDGKRTLQPLESHPLADLLNRPTTDPTMTGRLWRKQWFADYLCAGTASALIGWAGGAPVSLQRMHPARVDIEPSRTGGVRSVGYARNQGETAQSYDPSTVLLWRNVSWSDDPTSLFGLGNTQVLDADISAEVELARSAARSAKKGRPDAVYRPQSADTVWSVPQVKRMRAEVANMVKSNDGGVAVLNGAGKLEPLGWSPRDMANTEQRRETQTAIMALLGVPPIRLGLETANYATAREQSRVYWQQLKSDAAGLDEQLQRLADIFDEDLVVFHDFSGVEALQESEESRLSRVGQHIANGVPAADAYTYEGFEGIVPEPTEEEPPEVEQRAPFDLGVLTDLLSQARAIRSTDTPEADLPIEGAVLADMVLEALGSLMPSEPAEAR